VLKNIRVNSTKNYVVKLLEGNVTERISILMMTTYNAPLKFLKEILAW